MLKKLLKKYREYCFKIKTKNKYFPHLGGNVFLENTNVKIGNNVKIYNDVKFWGNGPIVIGNNVKIGDYTMIYSSINGGVYIGDDTIIAAKAYIIDMDHGVSKNKLISTQEPIVSPVHIGKDCWLGESVTVLKGATIGDGCVVGAKSLVNKDIDNYKIVVGIPAKEIKSRQ